MILNSSDWCITVAKVLVEGPSKATERELQGRTICNRVVNFAGDRALIGTIADIRIVDACTNSLRGELTSGDITEKKQEKGAA